MDKEPYTNAVCIKLMNIDYYTLLVLNELLDINYIALAIDEAHPEPAHPGPNRLVAHPCPPGSHPRPTRNGAHPGARNNVGAENKVGPKNKVGPPINIFPIRRALAQGVSDHELCVFFNTS